MRARDKSSRKKGRVSQVALARVLDIADDAIVSVEDALRRTVTDLSEAQRVAQVGSWRMDSATNRVVWTQELYRMLGLDPRLPPPAYTEHQRLFTPESWNQLSAALPRTLETGVPYKLELEMVRPDGSKGWMLARGEPLRDGSGRIVGARGTAQEITDRKRAEISLRRANRALRVLSEVNQALVRGESESGLLDKACKVLVEVGGYHLAWIGFVEHDADKSVRPVAQTGYEAGYLENAAITWANTERGRGPTGTAARTKRVQISNNIATDARMLPWRADALKRGYASSIALPLVGEAGALGVLSIYAAEADAFDADEVGLLQELAEDLAFGIVTHRSNVERQRAEARAERLAKFDALTELPNRTQLIIHLGAALENARLGGDAMALLALRADRFDEIQDGIGIAGADELLKKIVSRLRGAVGDSGFIARIAGESFAIVIAPADAEGARENAARLHRVMSEPFDYAGIPLDVQATIGVALYPMHGADPDSLLRRSDIAVRQARAAGNDYALYSGTSETESPQRLTLLAELRRAIRDDVLLLHYQPKIDVRDGRVAGAEALVRWPHPGREMVPPSEFIPLAEHTGLIKPITQWVLDAALNQIVAWRRLGIDNPIAVNVSTNNLRDPDFPALLEALHAKSGARLDLLEFEITETALMADPARSREVLARIRDLGVRISIDDFGTGYSSLSYIATLPIHALKIDRSFVLNMMREPRHRAVVAAAISLAHSLQLKVVAEGIETAEQAEALAELGCDELQGYFFSRPLPAGEFQRWYSEFEWASFELAPLNKR